MSSHPKPRIAQQMEHLLHSLGVTSYDSNVVHQLLELHYRFVSTIWTEAKIYSDHAKHTTVRPTDIRAAIDAHSQQMPDREEIAGLAKELNGMPLPWIPAVRQRRAKQVRPGLRVLGKRTGGEEFAPEGESSSEADVSTFTHWIDALIQGGDRVGDVVHGTGSGTEKF